MTNSSTGKKTDNPCALTVDVEDYFHVAAFEKQIASHEWGVKYPLRVEYNTYRLLELFDQKNAKGTFFTLGWVAQRCPNLVRAIVDHGHEIASHGYFHQRASHQNEDEFYQDLHRSKSLLEDIGGKEVSGYRAPSFSVNPNNEWAFEVLARAGYRYSSSTYPVKHDLYGAPDWPKSKYRRPEGIIELPIPTISMLGKNIPIGGGGFFRLYPYHISKLLIKYYLSHTGQPYSFYFHPWEIDTLQPRIKGASFKSQFRHYLNINKMESRISNLLDDFSWNTMSNVYQLDGNNNDSRITHQEDGLSGFTSMGQLRRQP